MWCCCRFVEIHAVLRKLVSNKVTDDLSDGRKLKAKKTCYLMKCNLHFHLNPGRSSIHHQTAHSLLNNSPHSDTLIKAIFMNINVSDKSTGFPALAHLEVRLKCCYRKITQTR